MTTIIAELIEFRREIDDICLKIDDNAQEYKKIQLRPDLSKDDKATARATLAEEAEQLALQYYGLQNRICDALKRKPFDAFKADMLAADAAAVGNRLSVAYQSIFFSPAGSETNNNHPPSADTGATRRSLRRPQQQQAAPPALEQSSLAVDLPPKTAVGDSKTKKQQRRKAPAEVATAATVGDDGNYLLLSADTAGTAASPPPTNTDSTSAAAVGREHATRAASRSVRLEPVSALAPPAEEATGSLQQQHATTAGTSSSGRTVSQNRDGRYRYKADDFTEEQRKQAYELVLQGGSGQAALEKALGIPRAAAAWLYRSFGDKIKAEKVQVQRALLRERKRGDKNKVDGNDNDMAAVVNATKRCRLTAPQQLLNEGTPRRLPSADSRPSRDMQDLAEAFTPPLPVPTNQDKKRKLVADTLRMPMTSDTRKSIIPSQTNGNNSSNGCELNAATVPAAKNVAISSDDGFGGGMQNQSRIGISTKRTARPIKVRMRQQNPATPSPPPSGTRTVSLVTARILPSTGNTSSSSSSSGGSDEDEEYSEGSSSDESTDAEHMDDDNVSRYAASGTAADANMISVNGEIACESPPTHAAVVQASSSSSAAVSDNRRVDRNTASHLVQRENVEQNPAALQHAPPGTRDVVSTTAVEAVEQPTQLPTRPAVRFDDMFGDHVDDDDTDDDNDLVGAGGAAVQPNKKDNQKGHNLETSVHAADALQSQQLMPTSVEALMYMPGTFQNTMRQPNNKSITLSGGGGGGNSGGKTNKHSHHFQQPEKRTKILPGLPPKPQGAEMPRYMRYRRPNT